MARGSSLYTQPALFAEVVGTILPAGSLGEMGAEGIAQAAADAARPVHWVISLGQTRATADTLPAAEIARRTLRQDAGIQGADPIVVGPFPGPASESPYL